MHRRILFHIAELKTLAESETAASVHIPSGTIKSRRAHWPNDCFIVGTKRTPFWCTIGCKLVPSYSKVKCVAHA